ncbi:MAG: (d)CMP kinase [Firmicutes bacterium]|nr:(d)CMP kinase [Ezakiella sp.]MDD7761977.1 (d)CMP kinase [Bacillota bacterium]
MIITLDGPSGSGKSTLSKQIAKEYGLIHIDSGAIYRTIAYYFNKNKLSKDQYINSLDDIDIFYKKNGVTLDGKLLKNEIRTSEITELASKISAIPEIRDKVNNIIRAIANKTSVVVDGRDIGSVVLPNADYKFYIDASIEKRARRRLNQMRRKNILNNKSFNEIYSEIEQRDKRDMSRKLDPLTIPDGAFIINTSDKKIKDSIKQINQIIRGNNENHIKHS